MYKECRIRNIKELKEQIRNLDEDEGIRISGRKEGFKNGGFIFLGFFRGKYCVNISDRLWNKVTKTYTAGGKEEFFYFKNSDEAWSFIEPIVERPLMAWVY